MSGVSLKSDVVSDDRSIDELTCDDAIFTNRDLFGDLSSIKDSRSDANPNTGSDPAIVIDFDTLV